MSDKEMMVFDDIQIDNLGIDPELLAELQEQDKKLAGGGTQFPRISLKGSRFRQIIGGQEQVSDHNSLNMVILNTSGLSRTYYAGSYDPENIAPPKCWSIDAEVPAPEVLATDKQSDRCATCPQNVKGSGQGDSRACSYNQQLAIVLEGELDQVYKLNLAATSIFGESEKGHMPMNAYAKFIDARLKGLPTLAILTQMYFDVESDFPKLFFKPVRALSPEEIKVVQETRKSPEAKAAVTLTVSQADGVQQITHEAEESDEAPEQVEEKAEEKQKRKRRTKAQIAADEAAEIAKKAIAAAEAAAKAAAGNDDDDDDDDDDDEGDIEEPKKTIKKTAAAPEENGTPLSDIMDEWKEED